MDIEAQESIVHERRENATKWMNNLSLRLRNGATDIEILARDIPTREALRCAMEDVLWTINAEIVPALQLLEDITDAEATLATMQKREAAK